MTTTVLISDRTSDKIAELRNELLHSGIGNLPGGLIEEIKQTFDSKEDSFDSFTKGAVVGIAVVAILYFLKTSRQVSK